MRFFKKKNLYIKRAKNEIDPEEIFLDASLQKREETLILEKPLKRKFILGVFFVFLLIAFFSLYQTFKYQIINHQNLSFAAQKNKFLSVSISAQRGVIYDRNLKQLVFNILSADLVCDREKIKQASNPERIYINLAELLETNPEEIKKLLEESKEKYVLLAENLDYKKMILVEGLEDEFFGCEIKNNLKREYQKGPVFSHIIGYFRETGTNYGLEAYYNETLKPEPGEMLIERDAKGYVISETIKSLPKPGKNLVLWLDADLQEKLYQTMKEEMRKIGAKKGVAVAMDPKTGGILAMVSIPSFDNNSFSKGITQREWENLINNPNKPLLNRVIGGRYPTGSTIKPLIAAAALQEGLITENKTINCEGKIVIDNPWFPDKPFIFRDWTIHGITNVRKAIAESCNVFFYIIGGGYKNFKGLGAEKIKHYLNLFGWGQVLGIDIGGEIKGFIPDKEWKKERFSSPNNIWMPGDTYNLSIGQGYILIPPLEVVASFAAIANGGKLLKPMLVQKIIDENQNVIQEFHPEVIREGFIDEKNLEIVREGMREAVIYGSATILNDLPMKAAAKTGTAQTSKEGYYHNWLTVFAPYDDPQIVLTLMVEEVPGLHVVVAPVAKEVLNWYFTKDEPSQ